MKQVRIVAGCPIANRAWAVHDWAKHLRENLPEGSRLFALVTPSADGTVEALREEKIHIVEGPGWSRPLHEMDAHTWTTDDYRYMALLRNMLARAVWAAGATWFASIDSDIRASTPVFDLIQRAQELGGSAIAPMINLQKLPGKAPAWNFMRRQGSVFDRVNELAVPTMEVDAIMAAMVIHRSMMPVAWAEHPQGEDLGWAMQSLNAKRSYKLLLATDTQWQHVMDRP